MKQGFYSFEQEEGYIVVGALNGQPVTVSDCRMEERLCGSTETHFGWNSDQGTIAWSSESTSTAFCYFPPEGTVLKGRFTGHQLVTIILPDGSEKMIHPRQIEESGVFFDLSGGSYGPMRWGLTPDSTRQRVEMIVPGQRFRCVGEDKTDVAAWKEKQAAREARRKARAAAETTI